MDGLVEEAAEVSQVPVRKGGPNGRRIFEVTGKAGINTRKSRPEPRPIEFKVGRFGLAVESGKRLLDHIPAIDAKVCHIESPVIDNDFISEAIGGRKRFGEHSIVDKGEGGKGMTQVNDDLNREEGGHQAD